MVMVIAAAGSGALLIWEGRQEAAAERAFMSECTQRVLHYECLALWHAGQKTSNGPALHHPLP